MYMYVCIYICIYLYVFMHMHLFNQAPHHPSPMDQVVSHVGATPFSVGLAPLVSARYARMQTASIVPAPGLAAVAPTVASLAACETEEGIFRSRSLFICMTCVSISAGISFYRSTDSLRWGQTR